MNIQLSILVVFYILFSFHLKAQNKAIENIRKIYSEAKTCVEESEEPHGTKTSLTYKRMIPALGSVSTTLSHIFKNPF